jgi:hypothetical protein
MGSSWPDSLLSFSDLAAFVFRRIGVGISTAPKHQGQDLRYITAFATGDRATVMHDQVKLERRGYFMISVFGKLLTAQN